MFERHRPALRRQASRLLYNSGHDSDDVLQDVFLRVHTALRGGVVPLEPRAWLLRLVHNACVDELRRGRTRAVGDVELDGMPALTAQLPDELARRAEARALIGDIHRLPERQRHVLVMSALDGLTHEEVAGRLDTTVETTRSLLARARENLRRTAAARETACVSVCDALDEAAAAGVRASELARRHLWSCSDCRAYQRDLRAAPRRLRRLAAWSPWGIVAQLLGSGGAATVQKVAVGTCCAIVGVGGAVAVPEIAVHSRHLPEITAAVPVPVVARGCVAHQACGADQGRADRGGAGRDALDRDRGRARRDARPSGREGHEGEGQAGAVACRQRRVEDEAPRVPARQPGHA